MGLQEHRAVSITSIQLATPKSAGWDQLIIKNFSNLFDKSGSETLNASTAYFQKCVWSVNLQHPQACSTGGSTRRGGITKAGNARVRWTLVEGA